MSILQEPGADILTPVGHIGQFAASADSSFWWIVSWCELSYLTVNSYSLGLYLMRPEFKVRSSKFASAGCWN